MDRLPKKKSTIFQRYLLRGYASGTKLQWERFDEFSQRIYDLAIKQLLESIQVSVTNQTTLNIQENLSSNYSNTQSSYNVNTTSKSQFDIANIKKEEFTAPDKTFHAFAYIKRQDVIDFYATIIQNQITKIQTILQNAQQFFLNNQTQQALKTFSQAFLEFDDIDKANNILNALNVRDQAFTHKQQIKDLSQTLLNNIAQCIDKEEITLSTPTQIFYGDINDGLFETITINSFFISHTKQKQPITNIPIIIFQDSITYCQGNTDEKALFSCWIKKNKK